MDVVHADRMQWGGTLTAHRAGHMTHKVLFEGEEGSPDNYLFVLANEQSDYYSPRHRHAWDQVRFCLEGSVPIARDLTIDAGEIGYFPEGVHYGPQQGGPNRIVLLLQIGGASGLGYLSVRQVQRGRELLSAEGVFEEGVFKRTRGEGKKNEDAYQAIWQAVTGRPLAYPRPRYKTPIILRPSGFDWQPVPQLSGARRKRLASFAERDLSLELVALDSGCRYPLPAARSRRLIFVRAGAGRCAAVGLQAHSAARLEPGEAATFSADMPCELFIIGAGLVSEAAAAVHSQLDPVSRVQEG